MESKYSAQMSTSCNRFYVLINILEIHTVQNASRDIRHDTYAVCMLCVASRKVKYYNLNLLYELKMSAYIWVSVFSIMEKQSFPWIYGTWVNKLNMARNNT